MNYTRTQAGTAAVLNPKIEIPRPLKALLISMDGGFDADAYASRLRIEQDVLAMLDTLLDAGYIQEQPSTGSQYSDRAEIPVKRAPYQAPPQRQAPPQPARSAAPHASASHRSLQDATEAITDFVMTYLPHDALEISFALEGLTSVAQLEASLHEYETKIRPLGDIAVQHLTNVKRILGHI